MYLFVEFTVVLLYGLYFKCNALPEDPSVTYDMLYSAGKEAYFNGRWYECFAFFERALSDYKFYHDNLVDCRLQCKNESPLIVQDTANIELAFFESVLHRSDCIRRCKEARFAGRPDQQASEEVEKDFKELKPYDFLQICAYKSEKYEVAASAAYTFLLENPNHETMRNNVAFYQDLPQISPSQFKDLEAKPFQALYSKGVEAYGEEDWPTAIMNMEKALLEYYQHFARCTAACEEEYDHEDLPEFYNAIAGKRLTDHWISVLSCQKNCPTNMATWATNHIPKYLQEHYNYLQYAYYKMGQLKKATAVVATFLLFDPADETMLRNKQYYLVQENVREEDFIPRPEVATYLKTLEYFQNMYSFVKSKYKFSDADEDSGKSPLDKKDDIPRKEVKTAEINPAKGDDMKGNDAPEHPLPDHYFGSRNERFLKDLRDYESETGIRIVAADDELSGKHRVMADNIVNDDECQQLVKLAEIGATQGDGYAGTEARTSPHTNYEKFEGMTVLKAAELAAQGALSVEQASLYLRAAESGRAFLQKYYNLNVPLYFHYTHLVCRTALQGDFQVQRNDLSHPVHADNCHIQKDGSCLKEPPAYVWRDISGLIYLNEDFEGGNFFFAHKNQSVQQEVRPKCGRMVGFEAANYHGVLPVTKGKRCAVAMWYTLDPSYQETAHREAQATLDRLKIQRHDVNNGPLKSLVAEQGYQITQTEADLQGPERFVAEGVATEEQCQMLIKLASEHAKVGDGYNYGTGQQSPHTAHERFAGMTLTHAAQLATSHQVSRESVETYLNLSQSSIELVQKYFKLDKLYFDFTHLACRTALDGTNVKRDDLSHPIHADNCILQPDNSCKKEPPAYVQRDYSALLYLNDDFEGGDFFFAHRNLSVQSTVKPTCGRMVAFNAGTYHGVKPVLSGQRCAIALWFTLDALHKEAAHGIAANLLQTLDKKPKGPPVEDIVEHGEL